MKYLTAATILSLFLAVVTSGNNQVLNATIKNGNAIDARLVGSWTGSESDNFLKGSSSEWIQIRKSDGTYSLASTVYYKGRVYKSIESGIWWVKDGLFYERLDTSREPDIYYYKLLSEKKVKFTSKKMHVEILKEKYEFIDTKID